MTAHALSTWEWITRTGAILGLASFVIAILLGLQRFGVFDRPKHRIMGGYHPPHDVLLPTTARFLLVLENLGNVPIAFHDFEIAVPRLGDEALWPDGTLKIRLGATFYRDGREVGSLGVAQGFAKVDYLSRRIEVPPHSQRLEFFELAAFEDELRKGLEPVLSFADSFDHRFHCDTKGVRRGWYVYPHQAELDAAVQVGPIKRLTTKRRTLKWLGWTQWDEDWDPDPAHRER